LAFKVDISKAFDTLDWKFLLRVIKKFGFCDTFCNWIDTILQLARLSICINGSQQGYFSCSRGVRQGDPLSPLLFCLAEDVLTRSLTRLMEQGKLKQMKGSRHCLIPSHILYADDIMIFCKGNKSCIDALIDLFTKYGQESGQVVSNAKSTVYSSAISDDKLHQLIDIIGFNTGSIPFNYLGVPIFKGKPRAKFLQPIVDKIKTKLSTWKASLLSIDGRVQLIKLVAQSMLIHTITVYDWPTSLLKEVETCFRNFIWPRDITRRKLVIVAWKKLCKPYSQGGLGIRSLITINAASNLKLCWDMLHSKESWAKLLKSRTIRSGKQINYHIFSSLWSSMKNEYSVIMENFVWLLGNGQTIRFWKDAWCGEPLINLITSQHPSIDEDATVDEFILDKPWCIPQEFHSFCPQLSSLVMQVTISNHDRKDELV